MNIDRGVNSSPSSPTTQSVANGSSDNSGDSMSIFNFILSAFDDFGNWLSTIFGAINAGNVSAKQLLKAMKQQQKLLVFVMAMSMAAVMFTVYMQEQ